jgi:hypothetical protein
MVGVQGESIETKNLRQKKLIKDFPTTTDFF